VNDLGFHLILVVAIGTAIAGISSIYSERSDAMALRLLPKRLGMFLLGCAAVAGVLLLVEHTLSSIH
jgi:hypothetical protein